MKHLELKHQWKKRVQNQSRREPGVVDTVETEIAKTRILVLVQVNQIAASAAKRVRFVFTTTAVLPFPVVEGLHHFPVTVHAPPVLESLLEDQEDADSVLKGTAQWLKAVVDVAVLVTTTVLFVSQTSKIKEKG